MHTVVQRVSATLTLAVTALAILCGLVSFSDLLHPSGVAPVDIRVKGVDAIFVHKGVEQAQLNIELHADLRPEFTWNTKQLYVAVTAEYATDTSPRNVVTLWNRIVESAEDAKLDIRRLPRMYPFIFAAEMNAASGLLGLDYNVTLSWNVMPKVGRLYTRSETVTGLRIPAYYIEPTTTTTKTS